MFSFRRSDAINSRRPFRNPPLPPTPYPVPSSCWLCSREKIKKISTIAILFGGVDYFGCRNLMTRFSFYRLQTLRADRDMIFCRFIAHLNSFELISALLGSRNRGKEINTVLCIENWVHATAHNVLHFIIILKGKKIIYKRYSE